MEFGLDDDDVFAIDREEVGWDIVPLGTTGDGEPNVLMLYHREGGQRVVGELSSAQVDKLIDASDFERRGGLEDRDTNLFGKGDYGDWVGIRPDSDWYDLVSGYRQASMTLGSFLAKETTAPCLYLCRHTLELQLKAIIMIGQRALGLEADLPSHHDLQRLWTGASPIARSHFSQEAMLGAPVKKVVDTFHEADRQSFNFRYPVTKEDRPIRHSDFVHAFSGSGHLERFREATGILDHVIGSLRRAELLKQLLGAKK